MAITTMPVAGSDPTASFLTQLYDLVTGVSGKDINQGKEAAAVADPFASQRPQYQQQLQGLLTDPSSFKTDPGYQFALGQGQEGISRAKNALYGGQREGNLAPELAKFTEGYASQAYDSRIQQLMQLSGANSGSPGTAGQILAGAFDKQGQALGQGAQGLSSLLGMLGGPGGLFGGIQNLLGGGSGGGAGGGLGGGGGSVTNPVPPGAITDPSGNVFDDSGNQIGTLDPNGNMIPSYPTPGFDPGTFFTSDPSGGVPYDPGAVGDIFGGL